MDPGEGSLSRLRHPLDQLRTVMLILVQKLSDVLNVICSRLDQLLHLHVDLVEEVTGSVRRTAGDDELLEEH